MSKAISTLIVSRSVKTQSKVTGIPVEYSLCQVRQKFCQCRVSLAKIGGHAEK